MDKHVNKKKFTIYLPDEIYSKNFTGQLFGLMQKETNIFNVINISRTVNTKYPVLGNIYKRKVSITKKNKLIGYREKGVLQIYYNSNQCLIQPYNTLKNIFSRMTGILESDYMFNKSVIISGLGSVGSLVALELARCGVGNYLLIDNDILEYHNLSRHQCGLNDIGKTKISAVKEKILQINPYAKVTTIFNILEYVPKEEFDNFINNSTIIVGCADNREGDLYANYIAMNYRIPFVSIGLWERAFAGEIFYTIPGKMPCYECIFGNKPVTISNRQSTSRRYYSNETELEKINFEPGISLDINFVTNIGIKIIIDLLNLENSRYHPKLLNDLTQFTLICNTNNKKFAGDVAEIFSYPLQISRSIKVDYSADCIYCNKNL